MNSPIFKNIYKDVLQYVNSKTRRRSPLALILDSHLMLGLCYVYSKTVILWYRKLLFFSYVFSFLICFFYSDDVEKLYKDAVVHR
jgi:ABC-type uncharacterized transport system permease subunit